MRSLTLPGSAPPVGLARSVWCMVGVWCFQGTALLSVGVSLRPGAANRGFIGGTVVASELGQPIAIGLVALGVMTYLGCVFLVAAQSYAQPTLCAMGLVGALCCAVAAPGIAMAVLVAMIVAVVLGMTTGALEHMHPAPVAENESR